MANIPGEIVWQANDNTWFTNNAAEVYPAGITIYHVDGRYKFTDGVTALSALPFMGDSSSSGVQSVTGSNVDNTDPANPVVNPLGLIKIVDLNGDFFTDLATANAYISTFTSATITDESFNHGVYYFTVPSNSDFSNTNFFLSLGIFTPTSAYIIDSFGLITVFSDSLCLNNSGNSIFGNITCGADSFTSSSGINTLNDVSADTPSFIATSGKFIFNGTVSATGIYLSDFFLSSTATILTNKGNLGNANLLQAESNGANVQYDGINLLPILTPQTTGVALTFLTDTIYGSVTTPETGNITFSLTGAKLGVTNLIYHNNGTEPTYSTMKKLSGSGDYVTGSINMIFVIYSDTTEVCYSINQRT